MPAHGSSSSRPRSTSHVCGASTSSPRSLTSWDWDFGDGNTSTSQNPFNVYMANGTYMVCLTISTSDSCSSTYCDTVVITCNGGSPTCNAAFQYVGCPTVSFTDYSTSSPGSITSWYWDFGDGNTDTGDVVLDPFIGSGTTAISAIKLDRHYIGIEKQRKWVELNRI